MTQSFARSLHVKAPSKSPRLLEKGKLNGRLLVSLGIAHGAQRPEIKGPAVVVIGSDSCASCLWARKWLSQQVEFSGFFVQNRPPEKGDSDDCYWLRSLDETIPSPAILAVNSHGVVTEEIVGWAEGRLFQQALSDRLSTALGIGNSQGKQL